MFGEAKPGENNTAGRKLFVGGIPLDATEAALKDFCSQFGEVEDVQIMMSRQTGVSRGFGFVIFVDPSAAEFVASSQASGLHEFEGKPIEFKFAVAKDEMAATKGNSKRGEYRGYQRNNVDYRGMRYEIPEPRGMVRDSENHWGGRRNQENHWGGQRESYRGGPMDGVDTVVATADVEPNKLFIGGLSPSMNAQTLKAYFSQYGGVVEATVMLDKTTGAFRGFGFVILASESEVRAVLADYDNHFIEGKWIEVKRCLGRGDAPPAKAKGRNRGKGKGMQQHGYPPMRQTPPPASYSHVPPPSRFYGQSPPQEFITVPASFFDSARAHVPVPPQGYDSGPGYAAASRSPPDHERFERRQAPRQSRTNPY